MKNCVKMNNERAAKLIADATEEMTAWEANNNGSPPWWTMRTCFDENGRVLVMKEYHEGPLSGKMFDYETGELCRFPPENRTQQEENPTQQETFPFLPAELNGSVGSVMPTDEVLRGGMCEFCNLEPCFSMRVVREVLRPMGVKLTSEGKSYEERKRAHLETGFKCFCGMFAPGNKPEKLPLCFGMH